jgi:hypothetical protein
MTGKSSSTLEDIIGLVRDFGAVLDKVFDTIDAPDEVKEPTTGTGGRGDVNTEPTTGETSPYGPTHGDVVRFGFVHNGRPIMVTGTVRSVDQDHRTARVQVTNGYVQTVETVPFDQMTFIRKENLDASFGNLNDILDNSLDDAVADRPSNAPKTDLDSYYIERLNRAANEAWKVSEQHTAFVKAVKQAMEIPDDEYVTEAQLAARVALLHHTVEGPRE